jgi:hypothetical protein
MPLVLTNCHTSCVSLPPLHETVMYVVMTNFCKLQYIIASWIEFLGTLDKLDVKGLELKKEQEDDKRGKNNIQRTVMRLMTNETAAQMSSVIIQTSLIRMRYTARNCPTSYPGIGEGLSALVHSVGVVVFRGPVSWPSIIQWVVWMLL